MARKERRRAEPKGSKKKRKLTLKNSEEYDDQISRLHFFTIKEMEHDHKMRSKAILLSQKRKKQADSLIV